MDPLPILSLPLHKLLEVGPKKKGVIQGDKSPVGLFSASYIS